MKRSNTRALVIAIAFLMSGAAGAADLECTVTPGDANYPGGCTSSLPNSNYGISWAVTGLAPGTYTYDWWVSSYYGPSPQPGLSCSGSVCTQTAHSRLQSVMETVSVTVTNTATSASFTLSADLYLEAVCGSGWC